MKRIARQMTVAVVLVAIFATQASLVEAAGAVTMPFRYRNTQNGATIQGNALFANVYYDATTEDCAASHRDPDGNVYGHAHLPHTFDFVHNGDTVTVTKSDWAWDAHYVGYTRVSNSTFRKNCFAHAASSPEVMFLPGWTAWTNASSQCEVTTKRKSYGDEGHVIVIVSIYYENPCVIHETSEKNASGGVYEVQYLLPGGTAVPQGKSVRKRK